ncbi:dioxygenase [Nocardia panacis]|uniref:Dioxygenase n=1 Tax=Nocardia panacis TaxID=2340916 RepID=A0A3A4KD43_9NOCA|nr:carotenoid oxygenase family protein [Nocardia panacis]RJO78373.1 dioxygenase [Nocardia panacis]
MSYLTPVPDEITAFDLPVTGTLPTELNGRYVRNGPNPRPGEKSAHVFIGHGMLHGIRLRNGRAEWYRNRWVRTGMFVGHPSRRPGGNRDLAAVSANTHIIEHAGRLMALVETGLPHGITPDLDTIGPEDFDGRLTTAMTAHPKRDPGTGDLHFFGYAPQPPHLTYHRLDATGKLVYSREIAGPGATMMHDFAITERHVVWLDLPVVFRPHLVGKTMPYQWDDDYGARLGLMRHDLPYAPVRWVDIDPCFVFHIGNAHEDAAGRVILDAVRYGPAEFAALWRTTSGTPDAEGVGRLHRWILDPAGATEVSLDDRAVEFPTLDDTRIGRPARYLYTTDDSAIIKYDLTGGSAVHRLPPKTYIGEAVFVPAIPGPRLEDDGWLLAITTRHDGSASQLLVLDASNPAAPPVAAVDLPRGVPAGFHGSWIPDEC